MEGNDGEINRERGVSGRVPALSLVSGEGGWQRQAGWLLWPRARPHTVPRCPGKAPASEGQGVEGGPEVQAPPKALQRASGGPLCPQLNHLTHLVLSAWRGLVHLGTVLRGCKPAGRLTCADYTDTGVNTGTEINSAFAVGSAAQHHN